MRAAIEETDRRRAIQLAYNEEHGITASSIVKGISDIAEFLQAEGKTPKGRRRSERRSRAQTEAMSHGELERTIVELEEEMLAAADELRFEYAARLRDEIRDLRRELRAAAEASAREAPRPAAHRAPVPGRRRPAELVRRRAPRPALAAHARPLRDPGQRGHAAADPGRPGRAPLRGLAAALADAAALAAAPRADVLCGVGRAGLQPARGSAARGLRRRRRARAGRATRRACGRCRASGRTRRPPSPRSRSARPSPASTRTSRAWPGGSGRGRRRRCWRPPARGARRTGTRPPMELGATVCGARVARCDACPLAAWCASRGTVALPARRRAGTGAPRERWEDSNRWARGRVVAALAAGEGLPGDVPARAPGAGPGGPRARRPGAASRRGVRARVGAPDGPRPPHRPDRLPGRPPGLGPRSGARPPRGGRGPGARPAGADRARGRRPAHGGAGDERAVREVLEAAERSAQAIRAAAEEDALRTRAGAGEEAERSRAAVQTLAERARDLDRRLALLADDLRERTGAQEAGAGAEPSHRRAARSRALHRRAARGRAGHHRRRAVRPRAVRPRTCPHAAPRRRA